MPADTSPWVDGLTIGDALRRIAERFPERQALVFCQHGFRATYAEYDRMVDEAACGLLALNVERGDHVAIWATNWPEWVILHLATARIGAVLVTINPAYRSHELAYALEQSDARLLFLIDSFKSSNYFRILAAACPELAKSRPGALRSQQLPELRWVVSIPEQAAAGMLSWKQMLALGHSTPEKRLQQRERELKPEQPINLQYTSGTTGFPKGVVLSHRNLLLNATYVGDCQGITENDRICVPVPFYHCFGCVIGTLCSLVHGACMLVPAEHFDPASTLDCVEQERATSLYGVPTMFIAELEDESFAGRDLTSLRTGIMAGSPCPVELMNRVVGQLGARGITIAYGLTEASPAITQTLVDDPLELRVGTVGRPIPGVEVRVLDAETGRPLPDGRQGELCARGHNVMLGYYKMPAASAKTIDADGWLHTGDLAVREPNGYLRITGRIKDMIIRGGENIYPREIEEFLYTHPKVEDVQVVGVPDRRHGEEVCAWIKLRQGEQVEVEEIRSYCAEGLAHYKVPRYIELVEEFPLTVTGKVQKFKIRERAVQDLGLEEDGKEGAA
ncbi:MAG: AMP-binding protein [Acidobacteriota bacterium]